MKAQDYEEQYHVRIKFASIANDGHLDGDSHEEYDTLFLDLPDKWTVEDGGWVTTRQEGERRSWLLRHGAVEIAAVEHETGIEILIAVGVNVASASITGFTTWAWKRWRESRADGIAAGTKVEPSLVLESAEKWLSDGRSRVTRRLEIRGPVTETEMESAISKLR